MDRDHQHPLLRQPPAEKAPPPRRRLLARLLAGGLLVGAATSLLGQKVASDHPHEQLAIEILPDYGGGECVYLQWTAPAAEDAASSRFEIRRRVPGPNGPARTFVLESRDTTLIEDKLTYCDPVGAPPEARGGQTSWSYQIRSLSPSAGPWSKARPSPPAALVWPPVATINVLHGFGSVYSTGRWTMHPGIDFLGQQEVRVVRSGRCGVSGDKLFVFYAIGNRQYRDSYLHVKLRNGVCAAKWVNAGDVIGTSQIASSHYPIVPHLHFAVNHYKQGYTSDVNPLLALPAAERDPHDLAPRFGDVDGDSHDLVAIQDSGNSSPTGGIGFGERYDAAGRPIATGEVDLVVDAWDVMAINVDLKIAPSRLGYWIEDGAGRAVVASRAKPYVLFDFSSSAIRWEVGRMVDGRRVAIVGRRSWPQSLSWVITNTRGFDGAVANIDGRQHWNTRASSSPTDQSENGYGSGAAARPQDARFPDGLYYVWVFAEDLEHHGAATRSEKRFPIVVDNWVPALEDLTLSEFEEVLPQSLDTVRPVIARASSRTFSLTLRFDDPVVLQSLCLPDAVSECGVVTGGPDPRRQWSVRLTLPSGTGPDDAVVEIDARDEGGNPAVAGPVPLAAAASGQVLVP